MRTGLVGLCPSSSNETEDNEQADVWMNSDGMERIGMEWEWE